MKRRFPLLAVIALSPLLANCSDDPSTRQDSAQPGDGDISGDDATGDDATGDGDDASGVGDDTGDGDGTSVDIAALDMGSVSDIKIDKVAVDDSTTFAVTLVPVEIGSGSYRLFNDATGDEITEDTSLPSGTVLRIEATPDDGYALDLAYAASDGPWGFNPEHSLPQSPYVFPLVADMKIGATFMEEAAARGYEIHSNIKYGETDEKHLVYDVVTPSGLDDGVLLPIIFVIHGGALIAGDPSIMIQMARQMAQTGSYVVCLMNYRFIGTADGNADPYDVNELYEDVLGAMAHFMNFEPETHHADVSQFVVTGDSAGGYLSASMGSVFDRIGTAGFDGTHFELWPLNLAEEDVAEFKAQYIAGIKAMAPSYGVFDVTTAWDNFPAHPDLGAMAEANERVSPIFAVASATVKVPSWQSRGDADSTISRAMVTDFQDAMRDAGWADEDNQYVEVAGAGHAFYDWKVDATTKATYEQYGAPHVDMMIEFFDKYVR